MKLDNGKLSPSSAKVSQKSTYNIWLPEFLDILLDLVKNFK